MKSSALSANLEAIREDKSPVCRSCRNWSPDDRSGVLVCSLGLWRAGKRHACQDFEREPGADDYLKSCME